MIISEKKIFLIGSLIFFILIGMGADAKASSENILPEGLKIEDRFRPHSKEDEIGRVQLLEGEVFIIHSDNPSSAYRCEICMPIYQGDEIITTKGRMHFILNDGSSMSLAPMTKLKIDEAVYDPNSKIRKMLIDMTFGKARFLVQKLIDFKQTDDFKVKTKTAVTGVRGSDFLIVVNQDTWSTTVYALDAETLLEIENIVKFTSIMLEGLTQITIDENGLQEIEKLYPEAVEQIKSGLIQIYVYGEEKGEIKYQENKGIDEGKSAKMGTDESREVRVPSQKISIEDMEIEEISVDDLPVDDIKIEAIPVEDIISSEEIISDISETVEDIQEELPFIPEDIIPEPEVPEVTGSFGSGS